jgi:ubiquinone/menaquinone biosynthesis C-methylase UbiE
MTKDFAKFEQDGWQRVAHKYEAAWSGLTRSFIPRLVQAVSLAPGQHVLDVACGPGYVAKAVREKGAEPIGVDFSAEMVRLANERNPEIRFVRGDAQALEFEDKTFDTVLMNFGLLHLSDPEAAFRESFRVLLRGGCYGFTVWAGPELSPGARIVEDAIQAHANLTVEMPQGPDYFCYGQAKECRNALADIGFVVSSVTFETIVEEWKVPSATFLFECERHAGVRTAALLERQDEKALAAIARQIEEGVAAYAKDGAYFIPFAAHVVTARKP